MGEKLYGFVKYDKITRKEVTSILKLGETKIKELFIKLIDKRLIQRVGAGRSTYYIIKDKNENKI